MKKIITFLLIMIFYISISFAGDIDVSKLPKLLGSNNMGREFYVSFIPSGFGIPEKNLKIFICSDVRTKAVINSCGNDSETYDIIPNQLNTIFINKYCASIQSDYYTSLPDRERVYSQAAIHIVADDPIICLCYTDYYFETAESFLAYPVNMLGTEYIVSSYQDGSDNINYFSPSYISIIAAYDKTKVTVEIGGNSITETAGGLKSGDFRTWNMNKGDVLQIPTFGKGSDLSGSKINSTKPVAVVSGNYYATIGNSSSLLEEMEIPTHSWGKTYHVAPFFGNSTLLRIYAKETHTRVYLNHEQIGILRDAGGTEGNGFLSIPINFKDGIPIVISADKPIGITQYNVYDTTDTLFSYPFQLSLISLEQYQNDIKFQIPRDHYGSKKEHLLNIIFEANDDGNVPDDLEIGHTVDSTIIWENFKSKYPGASYEFEKDSTNKSYKYKTILLPDYGVYKIRGNKSFQAYSYGHTGFCYGSVASASLKNLESKDTIPPNPEWKMDCNGNVNYYTDSITVIDYPYDDNIRSNLSSIYLKVDESFNYKLNIGNYTPCLDRNAAWNLQIIDGYKDARAVVVFEDCCGNDTTLLIEYYAPKVKFEAVNYDFGIIQSGDKVSREFRLISYSDKYVFNCTSINFLKKDSLKLNTGFSITKKDAISKLSFPITLTPLDTFVFLINFELTDDGDWSDSLGFGDSCHFWYKSYIEASVGSPIISVYDKDYYYLPPSNTEILGIEIENIGNINLKIYNYKGPSLTGTISKSPIFYLYDSTELNFSFENPLIIKPNEYKYLSVAFAPDGKYVYKDSIIFYSNTIIESKDVNIPDSICYLSGRGIYNPINVEELIDYFTLAPNPAQDKLFIPGLKENARIRIYDILGNLRYDKFFYEQNKIIDLSKFENGMYIININSGRDFYVEKFLIQK